METQNCKNKEGPFILTCTLSVQLLRESFTAQFDQITANPDIFKTRFQELRSKFGLGPHLTRLPLAL